MPTHLEGDGEPSNQSTGPGFYKPLTQCFNAENCIMIQFCKMTPDNKCLTVEVDYVWYRSDQTDIYLWKRDYALICCHFLSTASFHNVTLLLPSETARMWPVTLQLTLYTGAYKAQPLCRFRSDILSPMDKCNSRRNSTLMTRFQN